MNEPRTRSRKELDSSVEPAATASAVFSVHRHIRHWWYPLLGLILLGVLYAAFRELDLAAGLRETREWIDALGHLAPVVFVGVYVVVATAGFPSAVLTAAAGALFGALQGVVLSLVASILAALFSFAIARYLLRSWVRQRLGRHPRFRKIDRLSQERGAVLVLAVRMLNLLPFSAVNYGFGVTRVPLTTYLLASLAGMIPGIVVLVVGIDVIYQVLLYEQVPWGLLALVVAASMGLALTLRYLSQQLPLDDGRQRHLDR